MRITLIAILVLAAALLAFAWTHHRDECMKLAGDFMALIYPPPAKTAVHARAPVEARTADTSTEGAGTPSSAPAPPAKVWHAPAVIPSQPNWTWTTSDGKTYRNVKITRIEPDCVTILDSEGGARIPTATLPAKIQKQLAYDPDAAAEASRQRADDEKMSQNFLADARRGSEEIHSVWSNYQDACNQARAEKKTVLLYFTGSDWCPFCKLLDSQVLSTEAFEAFSGAHFVFVTVDFPKTAELPPDAAAQNQFLQKRFNVTAYPTLVAITPDGKVLGRAGYNPGDGPNNLIASLRPFCQR